MGRHQLGETYETVNHQVHRALEADLSLILLVGERRGIDAAGVADAMDRQPSHIPQGRTAEKTKHMLFA